MFLIDSYDKVKHTRVPVIKTLDMKTNIGCMSNVYNAVSAFNKNAKYLKKP